MAKISRAHRQVLNLYQSHMGAVHGLGLPLPSYVEGLTAENVEWVASSSQVPAMRLAALRSPKIPMSSLTEAARGFKTGNDRLAAAAAASNTKFLDSERLAKLAEDPSDSWKYVANPELPDSYRLEALKNLNLRLQNGRVHPAVAVYLLERAEVPTTRMQTAALDIVRASLPRGSNNGFVAAAAKNPFFYSETIVELFEVAGNGDRYEMNVSEARHMLNHPSGGLAGTVISITDNDGAHHLVAPNAEHATWRDAYDTSMASGLSEMTPLTLAHLLGAKNVDDRCYLNLATSVLNNRFGKPVENVIRGKWAGGERILRLMGESPDAFCDQAMRVYVQTEGASPPVVEKLFSSRLKNDPCGCLSPFLDEEKRENLFQRDGYSPKMAWKALIAGTLPPKVAQILAESDDPSKVMVAALFPHTSGFRLEKIAKRFEGTAVADLALIHPNVEHCDSRCPRDSYELLAERIAEQGKANHMWATLPGSSAPNGPRELLSIDQELPGR